MVSPINSNGAYYVRQAHFDNDRMAGSVAHWKVESQQNDSALNALSMIDGEEKQSNITAPTASFGELLDVINPLHHLPVVGNIYRNMTGDKISPVAQIIGGTIYGGGLGGLSAIANAAVQEAGSDDLASAVVSLAKSPVHGYEFIEDERSAGINRPVMESSHEKIEIASVMVPQEKPMETPLSKSTDIFETLETEMREPVTRVSIEIAATTVKKQQWNFNA